MMTDEMVVETVPFWKKRRYLLVLMGFLGFTNVYTLRVNLSVAIVGMTEIRTITYENGTTATEQYFDWDTKEQGLVLSSFFYGYILTQVIGGYIASRIGGKLVSQMIDAKVVCKIHKLFNLGSWLGNRCNCCVDTILSISCQSWCWSDCSFESSYGNI